MSYEGNIIDAHGHIYPDRIAEKATAAIAEFYSISMAHVGSVSKLRASAESAGIRRQLVCSTATVPEQVESINNFIALSCRENPIFLGFGTMHPDYSGYDREFERIKALGLRGIKLHTDFQRINIDDRRSFGMYQAAAEAELPILFHMGDDKRSYSEPAQLRRVMDSIPGLVAVAAHFGGYRRWDESIDRLKDVENLYFDTSSTLAFISPERAARMIGQHGEDRFFYGTDFPMWDHKEEFERFMKIPLSEEQRKKILWENFIRVFGEDC